MKRTLVLLVAAATVMMFAVSPAAAATSQNLSWGVADTSQFNFAMDAVNAEVDLSLHEGMYFLVTDTPPVIPNVITDWTQVPEIDVDAKWTNGTDLGMYGLLFIGMLLFVGNHMAVPIGNWTLMTELVQTYAMWNVSTTFTTNSAYWGMSLTSASGDERNTLAVSFLKSDGFLAKYTLKTSFVSNSTEIMNLSVIRTGLPNDLIVMLQDNILLVGIGVGVIVILGAVVCMKRK